MTEADHSLEAESPMTEIVHSQEQEATNVLAAAKLATEQRLQSAEQLIKHATTATKKDIIQKCAVRQRNLMESLKLEKEILFFWDHCRFQTLTLPLLITLR
jgi:hypothetical protein